jgi:hippurate hydrolase
VSLQSIVARNVDPIHRVVVTVGTFNTDSNASNVIAHSVRMKGTVRTLDPVWRERGEARVRAIAENTAAAFGASAEVIWDAGYPATINHVDQTVFAADAARAVAGSVNDTVDPILPAEDFAYMLEERPGAYMFLGNGDSAMCHHPMYNFDDDAIPAGCSWFVEMVEQRLAQKQ